MSQVRVQGHYQALQINLLWILMLLSKRGDQLARRARVEFKHPSLAERRRKKINTKQDGVKAPDAPLITVWERCRWRRACLHNSV